MINTVVENPENLELSVIFEVGKNQSIIKEFR